MTGKKCRVHRYWGCIVCPVEPWKEPLVRFPTLDNMSPNEYVRYAKESNPGCPVCRSRYLLHEYTNQTSSDVIEVSVACQDCESEWVEEFHLVTYDNVKYKKEKASE